MVTYLFRSLPIAGVRLISSDIRALIKDTSVFMQRLHGDSNHETVSTFFVGMDESRNCHRESNIVDRLHPIPRKRAAIESSEQEVKTIENTGSELFHAMREKTSHPSIGALGKMGFSISTIDDIAVS